MDAVINGNTSDRAVEKSTRRLIPFHLSTPSIIAPMIVAPDRDVPGTNAKH
ncbi:hypothetical protein BRPE67_CCDS07210 [Caballeronia cordobensis]|nr:hypothetical protein BRPE67_CCDS07210 [Burkholderia sp. RPE67]